MPEHASLTTLLDRARPAQVLFVAAADEMRHFIDILSSDTQHERLAKRVVDWPDQPPLRVRGTIWLTLAERTLA